MDAIYAVLGTLFANICLCKVPLTCLEANAMRSFASWAHSDRDHLDD